MDNYGLISLRPVLNLESENLESLQGFQNETLRPVLKMLNDKIVTYAKLCLPKLMNIQHLGERRVFVKQYFDKNPQKAAFIQGLVCGFFTSDEFNYYSENSIIINKRIKDLFIERIATSV
jgi:hypothetical protein